MAWTIRNIEDADIDAVLELNESAVPAVNSLAPEQMRWFAQQAAFFPVAEDDAGIAAFLIGLRPGLDYQSINYRWFCQHYDDFGYIDRIAVDQRARRDGLASRLYAGFDAALPAEVPVMVCEVNVVPPNPGSMRFHERQGFHQVGRQATEGGRKEVALLERPRIGPGVTA